MADQWNDDDTYWRSNYNTRPYGADRSYDELQGGYRYGHDAATRYSGRSWDDVQSDLETGWNSYEHRGQSTWASIKEAVRDAWTRATGGSSTATGTTSGPGSTTGSRTVY
ncbi:MAG: hypothetical protein ACR2LU_00700 [Luteitalea sp.]|nr:hypothetical protein [Acidobacteriota bacterium]